MDDSWKEEISTPALILNYNIMEQNMKHMAHFVKEQGINLRQHVKTAKIPLVAHIQQKLAGNNAKGIAVANVGEAEVYAQCGFNDILITNEIIIPNQIKRLVLLNKFSLTRACVDSEKNIKDLEEMASKYSQEIEVLIDLDVGFGRCGIKPGGPALQLARLIKKAPHLELVGLQAYEGHLTPMTNLKDKERMTRECMKLALDTRDLLNANGFDINYITASGSGTYMFAGKCEGITEIQPGTYVFSDEHIEMVNPIFKPAVTVLGTIQNKTGPRLFTIDSGLKAVPTGDGKPIFKDNPKNRWRVFTEEHAQFKAAPGTNYKIGDKIELIPAHVCITVNLYDFIHVIKDGQDIGTWPVLARGKNY
ncbi:MAG: alanine racemase [Promethearchaeota archaeon]